MIALMLLLVMSLAIIRSRESFAAVRMVTSKCALAMDRVNMASEILVECESLHVGTAVNIALEGTFVSLSVFT